MVTSREKMGAATAFAIWMAHRCPPGLEKAKFKAALDRFMAGKVLKMRVKSLPDNKTMVEMGCMDD